VQKKDRPGADPLEFDLALQGVRPGSEREGGVMMAHGETVDMEALRADFKALSRMYQQLKSRVEELEDAVFDDDEDDEDEKDDESEKPT
jgi:hypothetical protein